LTALEHAKRAAQWFQVPIVQRGNRNLRRLAAEERAVVVVVADDPLKLYLEPDFDHPLFFHPGMAHQRLAAISSGQSDRLVRAADVRSGDVVVDATLGPGTDSLVLAAAVGASGRVVAMESSPWLARLFRWGQRHEAARYPSIVALLERISVLEGEHTELLAELKQNSVDIVYFDPMFRHPIYHETANIEGARWLTDASAVVDAAWTLAQRATRRSVVLKERPYSGEFERFGLLPDKPRAKLAYGVWKKEGFRGEETPARSVYRRAHSNRKE